MFTGIVEAVGEVTAVDADADGRRLTVAAPFAGALPPGASVSVSGACLTVEAAADGSKRSEARRGSSGERSESEGSERTGGSRASSGERSESDGTFEVFLAAETVDRTSLGDLDVGDGVNLERAMPADGRFDGHLVQGHVDATAEVLAVEPVGEDWTYRFALPEPLAPYVVEKGSVTVDGVSLTVAGLDENTFSVAVIPTTYRETTLSDREPGDRVNLEVDVLAKYVERQLAARS